MAFLVPEQRIEDISLKPERDVARALMDQLPSDCMVFHSYPWLREDRHDIKTVLREGEADFVIVYPEAGGILVFEVKGGEIDYSPDKISWHRITFTGKKRQIKDPFKQAKKNMHYFKDELIRSGKWDQNLPFAFGYAVIFPDCNYSGTAPPGSRQAIILGEKDLPHLGRRIPEIIKKYSRRIDNSPIGPNDLEAIKDILKPAFRLTHAFSRKVAEDEERIIQLTNEQSRILDFLRGHKKAAIEGPAGSGKTVLALKKAKHLAEQNLNILFVCYNKNLAEWINGNLNDRYRGRLQITHFHGIVAKWCNRANIPFRIPDEYSDSKNFWRSEAPGLFLDAIARTEEKFDAIIVDEGQDFRTEWWDVLETLFRDFGESYFYIFYDPLQNLYLEQNSVIPISNRYLLETNCRNTRKIARECGQIIKAEIPVRETAPEGADCIKIVSETDDEQRQTCRKILKEWLIKSNLRANQIAMLSPDKIQHNAIFIEAKKDRVFLTNDLMVWKNNGGVLSDTIRSFKGLEADAVILHDIDPNKDLPYFTQSDLYVACSRAKHLLAVISRR